LAEAKYTEEYNRASLEYLTRMEEEKKKTATVGRGQIKGPMIRFLSKNGVNTITFTDVDAFPNFINAKSQPCKNKLPSFLTALDPQKAVCPITGQPAKYLEPTTLTPYATIDAFKAIKQK
jgi:vacuolar protein sorting-associated protein 72